MRESYAIPTNKIIERIRFENPWWTSGKPTPEMDFLPRRLYFSLFYPHVKDHSVKRALVLMGPRRVGKTVMMHHAIGALINEQIDTRKIFFIGIDNPIYIHLTLDDLLKLAMEAAGQEETKELYVFFDEIQYLKDWERHLKILVDSYSQAKFVVSGSAAAALRIKSSESGAGRFTDFMLPPLTFQEYLHLKKLQHLVKPIQLHYQKKLIDFFEAVDIKELNRQFFEYINYGGYPEVIFSETIQQNMSRYIKGDIIDKVLLRDLPSLYGIRDVQELNRFFAYLAYNTGREFSFDKICKESGIDKVLLRKYMEYLEAAFLIKVIHKIDDTAKQFKRVTGFKVYLTNTSLRSALFSPVDPIDEEAGSMVETVVFSQWLHRENLDLKYASWKNGRTEGEVDMILLDDKKLKPVWCVEIKWSNRYLESPGKLKSLTDFCEKNDLEAAIITTVDKQQTLEYRNLSFTYVPAAVYAYSVGVRTLKQKQPLSP
jgi:uncharacterized protein